MKVSKFIFVIIIIFLGLMFIASCCKDEKEGGIAKAEGVSKAEVALDVIMTRTSVRSYTNEPIDDQTIEKILRAGMAAPTAVNKQPWAFVVVTEKNMRDTLAANLPYARMIPQAPVSVVVCGDLSKALDGDAEYYWIQDCSAASENILLAAHALGLGAVWTGVYPIMDRVKTIQKILNLPSHIVPLNVIPIGYPAEKPSPKDKWKPESVHYNGW